MTRLGVLLAPEGPFAVEPLLETARAAAAADLGVWIPEHAHLDGYAPSALALAGLVLAAAPGARVGTAGVVAGARTPLSLLRDADVLAAAGAFSLGIVAGRDERDFAGAESFERRFSALDAVVDASRSHARRWPLLVGARTRVGLARAVRADGWLAPTFLPADDIAALSHGLGGCTVVAVRRWEGRVPRASRTPPELVLRGGERVRAELRSLAGVDEVVLGPVGSIESLERLREEARA